MPGKSLVRTLGEEKDLEYFFVSGEHNSLAKGGEGGRKIRVECLSTGLKAVGG